MSRAIAVFLGIALLVFSSASQAGQKILAAGKNNSMRVDFPVYLDSCRFWHITIYGHEFGNNKKPKKWRRQEAAANLKIVAGDDCDSEYSNVFEGSKLIPRRVEDDFFNFVESDGQLLEGGLGAAGLRTCTGDGLCMTFKIRLVCTAACGDTIAEPEQSWIAEDGNLVKLNEATAPARCEGVLTLLGGQDEIILLGTGGELKQVLYKVIKKKKKR